jgi:hypothetical protein
MDLSFEQTLIENVKTVVLGTERYAVQRTSKRRLHEVDFVFDGKIRRLEQNPGTRSRWAKMARQKGDAVSQ